MTPKPLLVVGLLVVGALQGGVRAWTLSVEAADGQLGRQNTWSARSSTGRTLTGTWTANPPDPKTGDITGTWTVIDAKGKPVARGGWSAAKALKGWTGAWRAIVSGSKQEYSGSWSADIDLKPNARFAELFEAAVKSAVSGTWRAGRQSGGWSIRAVD